MFTILNAYEAHPEGDTNWRMVVEFHPGNKEVRIYDTYGNGQSMDSFNNVSRILAHSRTCQAANVVSLVEFLESDEAQELLSVISEGSETIYDNGNPRGLLTEEGYKALDRLAYLVQDELDHLPQYWSAYDWFIPAGIKGVKVLGEFEEGDTIEEAAEKALEFAAPDYFLQQEDVEAFLRRQLEQVAQDEDLDLEDRNKARVLLGLPLLTTLATEWERYDQGPSGVRFTDYILQDGTTVTLVNDGSFCWLADMWTIDEALNVPLERAPLTGDLKEDSNWWYEQLCQNVPFDRSLIGPFEAELGERNWP